MKRLALLVGISEYPECKDLKPLHGSLLDVDAMQRVLVTNGEFAEEDVVILKNVSRQEIEESIHNLFNARERQKDDLVLFYFSGHGVVDEGNKLFLGTPSTRKEGNKIVKPTTVRATYLHDAMNDSKSQHQVLIFNCCFSGAFAQGMTVMDDGSVNLKNQLGGKGRAILTSSSMVQPSFQPDGEMSIYTRYLVEGIETGAADRDGDSKISIDELHEYAALKVSQESPNMTPAFYPIEQGGKIYIAKVAQKRDDCIIFYRRELENRMVDGKWSLPARYLLDDLRIRLGLSKEDVEQIKVEIETERLKPIIEKQVNLHKYEELLQRLFEESKSPTSQELKDLQDYQQDYLKLASTDVEEIDLKYGLTIVSRVRNLANNKLILVKEYKPQNLILNLPDGVKLELVSIPAGSFMMGSDDSDAEKPIHKVTLKSFKMGKYPITQKQYQAVIGNNPSMSSSSNNLNYPVESISGNNAVLFCQKLSRLIEQIVKLPTESQWEYACRAGSDSKYYFGDDASQLENYAWYDENTVGRLDPYPVGEKLPNDWGLYDMCGSVWEWCEDVWHDDYNISPNDGSAWIKDDEESLRCLRGGSSDWSYTACRSSQRHNDNVNYEASDYGFRIVI